MTFVISAKPIYEDGTEGDDALQELEVELLDVRRTGEFLAEMAETWIGTCDATGVRCDALDVSISEVGS